MASAAISIASSLVGGLLGQHSARLQGAKNENEAADQAIPAFDQDLQEIVSAWNSGQLDSSHAISSLMQVDAQLKQYLKSQVGKPGTAWAEYADANPSTVKCDKACTVGCCFYFAFIHPSLVGVAALIQGVQLPSSQAGSGVSRLTPGSDGYFSVQITGIAPGKYSAFGRPSYIIKVRSPKTAASVSAAITSGNPASIFPAVESSVASVFGGGQAIPAVESSVASVFGGGQAIPAVSANSVSQPGGKSVMTWFLLGLALIGVLLFARSR